jgi:hypothetical protein
MELTNFLLIFSAGIAVIWFIRIVIAFRRSRVAPHCWYCGATKVARSKTYRRSDYLPLLSLMVPLRCLGCLTRFYGVRGVRSAPRRHSVGMAQPAASRGLQVRVVVRMRIPAFTKPKLDAVALPN